MNSLEKRRRLEQALGRFGIALVASKLPEDQQLGVTAAREQYERAGETTRLTMELNNHLGAPHVRAQAANIFNDAAYVCLSYCLQASGLGSSPDWNPFVKNPGGPPRFELVLETDLPASSRIALGDVDGDGWCDVLLPGHGLFRNQEGSGRFEPIAPEMTLRGQVGVLWDLNQDGLLDVLIASPGKISVAIQKPGLRFEIIEAASPESVANPEGIGLFDGDGDGLPDVYLASFEVGLLGSGTKDMVLRNLGDGTFEDVTEVWGFTQGKLDLCGRGVSPIDFDQDGWVDIFVSNYRLGPNQLWKRSTNSLRFDQIAADPFNQLALNIPPPNLRVTDVGVAGMCVTGDVQDKHSSQTWGHTIGSVWGDIDNNGWLDLVCANLAHPRFIASGWSDISRVYLNDGKQFTDHSIASGIRFRETHSDPLLADFDNDGDLDLIITNTYPYFITEIYENDGQGHFQDVTWNWGTIATNAFGQAVADFDNDGDLDWFVCDGNRGLLLYRNLTRSTATGKDEGKNYIQIYANSGRVGTRVVVYAGEKKYVREVSGGRGSSSFDDTLVHFGLGDEQGSVDVEVFYRGSVQRFSGLEINSRHRIDISPNGQGDRDD